MSNIDSETKAFASASHAVETPLDLIRLSIGNEIRVKCRGDRMLTGVLHAYDQHLNMVLGRVKEVIEVVEVDEDTLEEETKTQTREVSSHNKSTL